MFASEILILKHARHQPHIFSLLLFYEIIDILNFQLSVTHTVEKFESAITATLANIQNGGGKNIIRLLGPKFGAQKSAILQHADIFVFPTYYPNECFPLVLLEAMQQHLPIISTHEGGIPEMVMQGRNGMLVEASDKTALAKNIADKKPIPKYPKTIGIITAPTGAAIRDILSTIKRRYPIAKTILFPALVQGDGAKESVTRQLKKAQEYDLDVIICGRGGGSPCC